MSRITTFTGKRIDPLHPAAEDIDIRDIAHGLSLLCRGNGQVTHFYSVAQHSLACQKEAAARGYSKRVQLACLLHDASEAYLSDVTRPVKQKMQPYLEAEKELQGVIWNKFFSSPLTEEELGKVKQIDDDMLILELTELLQMHFSKPAPKMLSEPKLESLDMQKIEREFLQCANLQKLAIENQE